MCSFTLPDIFTIPDILLVQLFFTIMTWFCSNPSFIVDIDIQWRIQDFPEEGAPTLKEAIIWPFFSQKLHEIERIWTPPGGAHPWRPLPLRSANDIDLYKIIFHRI